VVLTNAEKQRRWRAKRNALAEQAITDDDTDREIVRKIVSTIGAERARALARMITAVVGKPSRSTIKGKRK
jgi:hypothetical protein